MKEDKIRWLPHLEGSVPESAKGYTMSLYSIALEGWRRGLTLKFINENRSKSEMLYELSSGKKRHRFVVSRGDLITRETMRICRNKMETKECLQKEKIPTPDGCMFDEKSTEIELINYTNKIGYPVVLKPTAGTGGRGVIANIRNEVELKSALQYVREELGYKNVIIEKYFIGEDYRVYVIDKKVVGITKRIPANVIGNGKFTIHELIKRKNKLRKESPILRSSLIKVDKELLQMLKHKNYNLDSKPVKEEQVFLKSKNNVSAGGDPIDITDEVSPEIKQIALDGVKSIPGLPHAGVDLMVNVADSSAVILEINTQASIRSHLYPMEGKARNIPKEIIDYYFPETKANYNQPLIYFDFEPVWESFQKGLAKEYVLPNVPQGQIETVRFIVSGDVQRVNYGKWVRRQARDLNLHGYVKHLSSGQTSVIVYGEKTSIGKFRKILKTSSPKRATVLKVIEKERTSPVKVGFEIINKELDNILKSGYHSVRLKGISKLGQKPSLKRKTQGKKNKINYKIKYEKAISSTSWKLTKPVRLVGRIKRKVKGKIE